MVRICALLFVGLFVVLQPGSASIISGASDLIGTTYTVTIGEQGQQAGQMAGMTVQALFASGPADVCTFAVINNQALCAGTGFSVAISPDTSETHSATWLVSNLRTNAVGNDLTSVTFDGIPGNTAFNPALDDSNGGNPGHPNVNATCGQTATKGFGNCRSAETTSAGNILLEASVMYFNALHLAGAAPNLDIWAGFQLKFTNTFVGGDTFGYKIDTDLLGSAVMDEVVPEPGSLGIAALGLALLAGLRFRPRKS